MTITTYDCDYYALIGGPSVRSARKLLPQLLKIIQPGSMLELGCGIGAWTRVARDHGVTDCIAVDGDWVTPADLLIPEHIFRRHNFEQPLSLGRKFDLALSLEVAEHLSEAAAGGFVASLAAHADVVVFGAAMKFQGGTRHLNEQWPRYWIKRFKARGYECFDVVRPLMWGNSDIAFHYVQNAFIFVKQGTNPVLQHRLRTLHRRLYANSHDLCFIHPVKYTELATYESVSVRRLMPRLPGILFGYLPAMILREAWKKMKDMSSRAAN